MDELQERLPALHPPTRHVWQAKLEAARRASRAAAGPELGLCMLHLPAAEVRGFVTGIMRAGGAGEARLTIVFTQRAWCSQHGLASPHRMRWNFQRERRAPGVCPGVRRVAVLWDGGGGGLEFGGLEVGGRGDVKLGCGKKR